jgi:hypothetical protein
MEKTINILPIIIKKEMKILNDIFQKTIVKD